MSILLVVLFHLRATGFGGGFVGVDVFFAISGFLIFQLLHGEYERLGRIHWGAFFARRVTRLLPEMTAMIIVIMGLGHYVLLIPSDEQALAKSGVAGALWTANIYFWQVRSDYFSPLSERQPLLHLWSLGVEEQFYALIPVAFVAASLLTRHKQIAWWRSAFVVIGILCVLSLAIALWGAERHATANYYLLPSRGYEFALGMLAALATKQASLQAGIRAANWAPVFGLMGIAGTVIVAGAQRQLGGWMIVPAASASLILWGWAGMAGNRNPVRRLMASGPIVYLGQISYGWYLWHFPLLVLWREWQLLDTTLLSEGLVVTAALIPAALGHHAVSKLRIAVWSGERVAREKRVFAHGVAGIMLAICVSGITAAHSALVGSRSPDLQALQHELEDQYRPGETCFRTDELAEEMRLGECVFGDPAGDITIVLWGDSHANHWVPALDPIFRENRVRGIERAHGACFPTVGNEPAEGGVPSLDCLAFNRMVLDDLKEKQREGPVALLLSARWGIYLGLEPLSAINRKLFPFSVPDPGAVEGLLAATVSELSKFNVPAGLILQAPEQRLSAPMCARLHDRERCEVTVQEQEKYLGRAASVMKRVIGASGIQMLDPSGEFCEVGRCTIRWGTALLYHDDNHLSLNGARLLGAVVDEFVMKMRNSALANHSHGKPNQT